MNRCLSWDVTATRADIWSKSIPSRGDSKSRCPKVGVGLAVGMARSRVPEGLRLGHEKVFAFTE